MEDLKIFENILLTKRNWVTCWPDKAVFIYSGGLDSTCTIARLLEEKHMEIYPLFINRGQKNVKFERTSVLFYEKLFKDKYPKLFHNLKEIEINVPPKEIKNELKSYSSKYGYPLRNTLLQMIGVEYAISLLTQGAHVTSVFCAQVPDDPFPHSTLISLRTTTVTVCQNLAEWDWQISSPNIDPFLETRFYSKKELILWATKQGLPLEKTWSCYGAGPVSCGVCLACKRRQAAFNKAGVEDKTEYLKRK